MNVLQMPTGGTLHQRLPLHDQPEAYQNKSQKDANLPQIHDPDQEGTVQTVRPEPGKEAD